MALFSKTDYTREHAHIFESHAQEPEQEVQSHMRREAELNGVRVKAYAGTTGIMLAFQIDKRKRKRFLGFAVSRKITSGHLKGRIGWLQGMLDFSGSSKAPGELIATNVAPLQKFRWSDYSVYPGVSYAYTVYPVYHIASISTISAQNRRLYLEEGPTVEIQTQDLGGENAIIFNRAVASSQAFSRRFSDLDEKIKKAKEDGTLGNSKLTKQAMKWLSRGLVEQIEAFLKEAKDHTWAIDLAIYEYHLERLHKAMVEAGKRGVRIRVLYHAKKNDKAADENEHLLNHPKIPNAEYIPRVTTAIMHNKFAILSRVGQDDTRQPVAVLAGSTNWTENGCYRQANVVHINRTPAILEQYRQMFDDLIETKDNRRKTKGLINRQNPFPAAPERFAGFSPRSQLADIDGIAQLIKNAKQDVMFVTAFRLHNTIREALMGAEHDKILRLGMENKKSSITGFHRDRTASFQATALLSHGLEGWLKESSAKQRGNIRVHTKAIIIDATTDAPIVISGSHNFSNNASKNNDENYLIIRRDFDVADVYLCELMRIYDHYRFRYSAKESTKTGKPMKPPVLIGNDSWTDPYFEEGSLKYLDRLYFSGSMGDK